MARRKEEYSRLNRAEKDGGGIHFDMPNGTAKAPNGVEILRLTDEQVDRLLNEDEPK